jgi:hypothetical protein
MIKTKKSVDLKIVNGFFIPNNYPLKLAGSVFN